MFTETISTLTINTLTIISLAIMNASIDANYDDYNDFEELDDLNFWNTPPDAVVDKTSKERVRTNFSWLKQVVMKRVSRDETDYIPDTRIKCLERRTNSIEEKGETTALEDARLEPFRDQLIAFLEANKPDRKPKGYSIRKFGYFQVVPFVGAGAFCLAY